MEFIISSLGALRMTSLTKFCGRVLYCNSAVTEMVNEEIIFA